jgi:hypothetical protein
MVVGVCVIAVVVVVVGCRGYASAGSGDGEKFNLLHTAFTPQNAADIISMFQTLELGATFLHGVTPLLHQLFDVQLFPCLFSV